MRLSFATFLRIMVLAPIAFSHASAEDSNPTQTEFMIISLER